MLRMRNEIFFFFHQHTRLSVDTKHRKIVRKTLFVKIVYVLIADCGAPPVITRATISAGNTLEGSIRMYTCDANTLTQGTINTRCQLNGQWTSVDLYCRRE